MGEDHNCHEAEQEQVSLKDVEAEIRGLTDTAAKHSRVVFLKWLRSVIPDPGREHSIADLLIIASKTGHERDLLPVVLRAVAGGALPETDSNNELTRAIVSLYEKGMPELASFMRVEPKAQTYVKLGVVQDTHAKICDILSPIRAPFSDMDVALGANKKQILGALNHSIVRSYCAVFDLQQIKGAIEDVYHKLKLVSVAGTTLLADIEACKKAISDGRGVVQESGSFLAYDFLSPFLDHVEISLDGFLKASRGKFATTIRPMFNGALQKRYPLHEAGRELQISIPFSNAGPGLATSVKVTTALSKDQLVLSNKTIYLGNVPPGYFSVVLDVMVIEPSEQFSATMLLEWGEIGESTARSDVYGFEVCAQKSDIDWASKEYWNPYSTEPAEGHDFIGRLDKVRAIAARLLKTPMESFYITGQKRVGKTSLALACVEFAKAQTEALSIELIDSYNLWGSFAYEEPRSSLEALGRQIEGLIREGVPVLRDTPLVDLSGSLSPLIRLCDKAFKLAPAKRFVVIIDEFDEIHQELYLHGNLAETFFANLRALSRCKNICLVLVGGENMPYVMERQGQKLNNFSMISLSYYNREREWSDFRSMVQEPSQGVVHWHEDAVGQIFNITNGNPYFAKIVCAAALENAIIARDSDISIDEVAYADESRVSLLGANSFAHLWQDGIPKPMLEREPDILMRIRVLVALARCYRNQLSPSLSNIHNSRGSSRLSEAEAAIVLNDFVRREVLTESNGLYTFLLPIFEKWLVDVGAGQLAADSLTAELADAAIAEEMAAAVRSDEIAKLVHEWPTYRGRHIGSDEVRSWIQQVESAKEQRLLFELLKRVRIFTDARIREMLEQSFSFLQPLPEFVIRKRSDRRRNIIVTYVDGEGKSGPNCASIFAESNMIAGDCIFPPGEFEKRLRKHMEKEPVDAIVVVDDLVGTGKSLLSNVRSFIDSYSHVIPELVPIRLISLVATREGQEYVLAGLQKLAFDNIDFKPCEVLTLAAYAFPVDHSGWSAADDYDRAKSLCIDIGRRIYKSNPLGYGGDGLLVVFPTNTPNNTLPLLHTASRGSAKSWKPLFERVTH